MDGRRSLTFANLDAMMAEVDRLLAGHRALGRWSLGQVCNHLAMTLRYSAEGFPSRAPWPVRMLVGPILKRRILRRGKFPDGLKIPGADAPGPGLDDRAEAEALRATVRLLAAHAGPLAPHPVFGRIGDDDWRRLHCIHAAHHLGFLSPEPRRSVAPG